MLIGFSLEVYILKKRVVVSGDKLTVQKFLGGRVTYNIGDITKVKIDKMVRIDVYTGERK